MSFIVGSCDGDGVAQRKLSIQQTFTVDRSEACDSYSRTTFPGGTPYPPVEGLYLRTGGGAVCTHRWRSCMYRFGERLYCIKPRKPEIVNVCALCV